MEAAKVPSAAFAAAFSSMTLPAASVKRNAAFWYVPAAFAVTLAGAVMRAFELGAVR